MRPIEFIQYLLGLGFILSSVAALPYTSILNIAVTGSIIMGHQIDGTRAVKIPFIIGHLVFNIFTFIFGFSILVWLYCCGLFGFSAYLCFDFGNSDFEKYKMYGPYQVGYQTFQTKLNNKVSVFYPISKEEYNQKISSHNVYWLEDFQSLVNGFSNVAGSTIISFILSAIKNVKMNVVLNANIDQYFTKIPIIPVIYSHGMRSSRNLYSGTAKDLASNGFIVFVIDHKDGSNLADKVTESRTLHDLEFRQKQLLIREQEIMRFIDQLQQQPQFLQDNLKFPNGTRLAFNRLIVGGHSFGGATAIGVGHKDNRVKAVIALDPWLYVYSKPIQDGQFYLSVPVLAIITDSFHGGLSQYFDSYGTLQSLLNQNKTKQVEHIVIKNSHHIDQMDFKVILPVEMGLLYQNKATQYVELYQLNSKLMLSFLQRLGFNDNDVYNGREIEKMVDSWGSRLFKHSIIDQVTPGGDGGFMDTPR